jgi:flagellar motor switch protein FliG
MGMKAPTQIQYMTPLQKVAALLIAVGPSTASEVLKHFADEDILDQVTLNIAGLNKITSEVLDAIVDEFRALFQANNFLSSGGMDYAKELLEKAYGDDKAQNILGRLVTLLNANPFQFFSDADPAQLATSFQNENPQLISLILAYLKPDQAAKVLNNLPPEVQTEVSIKISDMDTINPEVLSEIEKIVEAKFSSIMVQDFSKAGGVNALANILNRTDRATEKNVLEMLEQTKPELAEGVRALMFVFEDIIKLDDRSVQRVLREVDTKDLALSLKGIKEEVRRKILNNMSERAQQILLDDMEYMGPVRAKSVQEVQTKIVGIIRTLEQDGEILIKRDNMEDELIG